MSDPKEPAEHPAAEQEEGETIQHLHLGLGVGARELAAIGESGEKGTLEQDLDEDDMPHKTVVELSGDGRAASVLDRKKKD